LSARTIILFVLLAFGAYLSVRAQVSTHRSYALYVQSITKYSSWPVVTGDFKIIVFGQTQAFEELQKSMDGKVFSGAKARVVKTDNVTDVIDASIVYLADEKSNQLSEILKLTDGKPVMIVTERERLHLEGAGISFTTIDNRIRYDMNLKDMQKRNLKTAMQVVTLAHETL
jgi:hypothetical protein